MNTPAHAIAGLLLFGKQRREKHALAIVAGSLLPDAPLIFFYLWMHASGLSERQIWRQAYFDPRWQALFDTFHSFPLLSVAALIAWQARLRSAAMLFAAMIVHSLFDFPLHVEDAHRHFWPLSDFRFHSPVSYWNPAHFGAWVAPMELLLVVAGGAYLLRSGESVMLIRCTAAVLMLYLAFWGFAALMWAG